MTTSLDAAGVGVVGVLRLRLLHRLAEADGGRTTLPRRRSYPDVPVLVLNGDLDLRTDVYQARAGGRELPQLHLRRGPATPATSPPSSTPTRAPSVIARRFIATLDAGDTSCTDDIPEHRVVQPFRRDSARASRRPTWPASRDESTARDRRAAYVAVETVADVVDRWYAIPGYTGNGLYGGQFSMYSTPAATRSPPGSGR